MNPEELASAHWGYVKSLLELHGEEPGAIEKCGEHYQAAFVHGFKHGVDFCDETELDNIRDDLVDAALSGKSQSQLENLITKLRESEMRILSRRIRSRLEGQK